MAFAGFRAGEAEGLRRAMSRKRSEAAIRAYEEKFVDGAIERGAAREVGRAGLEPDRRLLGLRLPQGALGGLRAARLPVDLAARALPPRVPLRAAERAADGLLPARLAGARGAAVGVEVLPPCVVASGAECRVEDADGAVRLGLGYVNGVQEQEIRALVAERDEGGRLALARRPRRRARAPRRRRSASWPGRAPATRSPTGPARAAGARRSGMLGVAVPGVPVAGGHPARAAARAARGAGAARAVGLGADARRLRLDRRDAARAPAGADAAGCRPTCARARELERGRDGRRVRVAGLVVARQRPATAKGVTFMLLEDELGTINLIVPPPVHERFRLAVRARAARAGRPAASSAARAPPTCWSTGSSASSGPTCRARRSSTSSRAGSGASEAGEGMPAGGGRPARGRPRPGTASGGGR